MDILFDVLLRLPANDLCRLRAVCRPWRSLTYDPVFIKDHPLRHRVLVGLRAYSEVVDLSGNIVKRLAASGGTRRLTSRPRLELSSQLDLVCVSEIIGRTCVVINSATGDVTVVPSDILPYWHRGGDQHVHHYVLVAHLYNWASPLYRRVASTTPVCHTMISTCRLVTLWHSTAREDKEEIRWKARPPRPPSVEVSTESKSRIAIGGVAYFLVDSGDEPDEVASFDLATEEWGHTTLQGPVSGLLAADDKLSFSEHRSDFQLAELKGHLVMVHCRYYGSPDPSTDLWFLEDRVNGLWSKRYSSRYERWSDHQGYCYPRALVALDDEKIIFSVDRSLALKTYDPRTNTWADLAKIGDYIPIGIHRGSLLCPNLQYVLIVDS